MTNRRKNGVKVDCAHRFNRLIYYEARAEIGESRRSHKGRLYALSKRTLALPEGAHGVDTTYYYKASKRL